MTGRLVPRGAFDEVAGSLATAALDRLGNLIAVVDGDGMIVLTNAAWRAASDWRGSVHSATGPGVNYIEVCDRSDAAALAAGLRAVLAGHLPRFEFDYPCEFPLEDAWYTVEVLALGEPGMGAVVTHTDVTARFAADEPHRPGWGHDSVTLLPTSPSAAVLAQLLTDAQSQGNSVAVVTITLSDLAEIEMRHGRRGRDEVVVQVASRLRRLTRVDDGIFRVSTNQLVVVVSVADTRGGEYLGEQILKALQPAYLVGDDVIEASVSLAVTASDRFSTLESLLPGSRDAAVRSVQDDANVVSDDADSKRVDVEIDTVHLPLMVFSLSDGYLQAANDAARVLYRLGPGPDRQHIRDISDPADVRKALAAFASLRSGATDSYRAQRTLKTDEGSLVLFVSARRLVAGRDAFAVALTVPALPDEETTPDIDGSFSIALVVGTVLSNGAVDSVSSPGSPMEAELGAAVGDSLEHATHPDDVHRVAAMLESTRLRGRADGVLRVLHADYGWVVCQCQMFTIRRHADETAEAPLVGHDAYAFVLSANVSNKSMIDRIARLERHIRRIGSEVSSADLDFGVRQTPELGRTAALDALEPTARQRDIVERLARGERVSSIAAELFISRSTVRNHLAQVFRLAGVHSQDELLNKLRGQ